MELHLNLHMSWEPGSGGHGKRHNLPLSLVKLGQESWGLRIQNKGRLSQTLWEKLRGVWHLKRPDGLVTIIAAFHVRGLASQLLGSILRFGSYACSFDDQYCEYWRHKLRNNKKVEFPPQMSARVADITSDFSFAYMKEAFVAALLVIVARTDENRSFRHREDDLSDNILWKEIKKQVEALRKEMDDENDNEVQESPSMSGMWPALSSLLDEQRARPMNIGNPTMHF